MGAAVLSDVPDAEYSQYYVVDEYYALDMGDMLEIGENRLPKSESML